MADRLGGSACNSIHQKKPETLVFKNHYSVKVGSDRPLSNHSLTQALCYMYEQAPTVTHSGYVTKHPGRILSTVTHDFLNFAETWKGRCVLVCL